MAAGRTAHGRPRRDWTAWAGIVTAIVAAVSALVFNGISALATGHQIDLQRQGQFTDRYSKAVEQLGANGVNVRLGGVYALERLMRDSPSDQPTIVEVLSAFIRNNARPRTTTAPVMPGAGGMTLPRPETDVLGALTVLARRDTRHDAPKQATDLSRTDLSNLDLRQVDLHGANLVASDLHGSSLRAVDLTGANLAIADFSGADLTAANLAGAQMFFTDLAGADLTEVNLAGADFVDTNLTGANLDRTKMTDSQRRSATFDEPAPSHVSVPPPTNSPSR
jgi:hypothetical protein